MEPSKMAKISYKFKALPEGEEKLPHQATVILKTLRDLGADEFHTRETLVAELDKQDGDRPNKLNARQPVERVVGFYQKRLLEGGYWEINKEAAPKKEKAEKNADGKEPAKTTKGKVPGTGPAETPEQTAESVAI